MVPPGRQAEMVADVQLVLTRKGQPKAHNHKSTEKEVSTHLHLCDFMSLESCLYPVSISNHMILTRYL
jgi:hypothetical protein